jgi:Fic family protein
VHPFVDGNGRLHRWLIHHVLAAGGFNPPGVVFPISAAILRRIDEYRAVLESYSTAILPFIEWRATADGTVEVLNETADYYRYFDATAHAEFLYACVEQTVEHDLPEEVRFLEAFDRFSAGVKRSSRCQTGKSSGFAASSARGADISRNMLVATSSEP